MAVTAIEDEFAPVDPNGDIEVRGYIVASRGRFGLLGVSRQEIEAVPSSEYTAPEAIFAAVRQSRRRTRTLASRT
jgi:hypothetical protein